MLYKAPGPHEIHGGRFDYTIVPDEEIEQALVDGWYLTTTEAKAAHEEELASKAAVTSGSIDDSKPATREELEQKAAELGIPYGPKISDKKLRDLIAATLGG